MYLQSIITLGIAASASLVSAAALPQPPTDSNAVTRSIVGVASEDLHQEMLKRTITIGGTYADWLWWDAKRIYKVLQQDGKLWDNNNRGRMDVLFHDWQRLHDQGDERLVTQVINELHDVGRMEITRVFQDALAGGPNYNVYGDGNGHALAAGEKTNDKKNSKAVRVSADTLLALIVEGNAEEAIDECSAAVVIVDGNAEK